MLLCNFWQILQTTKQQINILNNLIFHIIIIQKKRQKNMSRTIIMITIMLSLVMTINSLKIRILLDENSNKILTQSQIESFSNIKLVVDGSHSYIYPEINNVFTIPNLSNGVHIIEAISNDYLFPVLIVDKRVESSLKMKWLNPLDRKFMKAVNQPYLTPIQKIRYFEPEPSFPLLGFFMGGNGLFIAMGVLMVFCYKGMNKLAESQLAPNTQPPQQHSVAGGPRNQRRA